MLGLGALLGSAYRPKRPRIWALRHATGGGTRRVSVPRGFLVNVGCSEVTYTQLFSGTHSFPPFLFGGIFFQLVFGGCPTKIMGLPKEGSQLSFSFFQGH